MVPWVIPFGNLNLSRKQFAVNCENPEEALCFTDLMSSEKTFKNPELTLVELAQLLNVHPNILSQIINSIENKNFYDYTINDFKIYNIDKIMKINSQLELAI